MANYGYVTTRRTFKPEKISQILSQLNKERFKNLLTISTGDDQREWIVLCPHKTGGWYLRRICWLETSRKFAISHGGGGGSFAWWVDFSISNAIALEYNGTITDDGDSDRVKPDPNYCPIYPDFLRLHFAHIEKQDILRYLISAEIDIAPPEFGDDLRAMLLKMIEDESAAQALSMQPSSSADTPSS